MAAEAPSRYCYVKAGVITPPPPATVFVGGRAVQRNPFPRPSAVGALRLGHWFEEEDLSALGVYPLVVTERGAPPGLEYLPTTAEPAVDAAAHCVRVVEGWRAMTEAELTDALTAARRAKLAELATEAETRLAAINPWIDSLDAYQVLQAVILTIRAEARATPPALLVNIKAVADAGQAARGAIQALTTLAAIAAYDVTTDPDWP